MELRETVMQEGAPEKVDETGGVLYGVKVIGLVSENGRKYPESTLKKAVPLYDGRKSYIDHEGANGRSEQRSVKDWIGTFRSPRFIDSKGVFADLHLRKKHSEFGGIVEAARDFPTDVGFSHVADGDMQGNDVSKINEVLRVDLVGDPATTKGFFESKDGGKPNKELAEYLAKLPSDIPAAERTKLVEAITDAWPTGPASDPQYQITLALLSAVQDLARSIMSANQQTAQANADATKQAADKAAAEKAAADKAATDKANAAGGNVPPTLESIQRKLDLADAKNELLESGRASKVEAIRALQIETLADCKDPARRKSLLESWPKPDAKALKEGRQPRPFERPDASPPASGTADGGAGEMSESLKASLDRRQKTLQEGKIPQRV